jgi:hypothetical protein
MRWHRRASSAEPDPGAQHRLPEAEGLSQRPALGGDTAVVHALRFVFSETAHEHAHALVRLQGLIDARRRRCAR